MDMCDSMLGPRCHRMPSSNSGKWVIYYVRTIWYNFYYCLGFIGSHRCHEYHFFFKWDIVCGRRWSEVAGMMGTLTQLFRKRPFFSWSSHIFILTFSDRRRRKRIANLFYRRRNRETSDFITMVFLYEWVIFVTVEIEIYNLCIWFTWLLDQFLCRCCSEGMHDNDFDMFIEVPGTSLRLFYCKKAL